MFDHLMEMSDAGVQVFVRQDQDATTKVQRGMHSRFAARGRYSWQEESHVQFNRWLVQRYRQHWPATPHDRRLRRGEGEHGFFARHPTRHLVD